MTYDTGALIAAERNDRRIWSIHRRALANGVTPTVPAGVVVEGWRGDAPMADVLRGCVVEPLTQRHAAAAGLLLGQAPAGIEAVDAMVVEGALRRRDAVVTGNRAHIAALAEPQRLHIIDV